MCLATLAMVADATATESGSSGGGGGGSGCSGGASERFLPSEMASANDG